MAQYNFVTMTLKEKDEFVKHCSIFRTNLNISGVGVAGSREIRGTKPVKMF